MSRGMELGRVWAEVEDHLVPYLRLDPCERALYYHLLRHTRVAGKRTIRVSKRGLTYSACLSITAILNRLRSLERKGCLKIVERSYSGHVIEVLTPAEIPGCVRKNGDEPVEELESANAMKNPKLRKAIFQRDRGRCFYCLRRLDARMGTLDHVVAHATGGDHSYRNVVACCFECNLRKQTQPAGEFLRLLRREGRLTLREYKLRRRALRALLQGRIKPKARRNQYG